MSFKEKDNDLICKIKVTPNSSKNEIIGWENDVLKVKIKAPPEKGKANKELIHFFSKIFDIPKSRIEILQGDSSRTKTICLKETKIDKVNERFQKYFLKE